MPPTLQSEVLLKSRVLPKPKAIGSAFANGGLVVKTTQRAEADGAPRPPEQ